MKKILTIVTTNWLIIAGAGLTLASGVIYGRLGGPSIVPAKIASLAATLQGIPDRVGDWKMETATQLDDEALDMLQCQGYINRTYRNEVTGEQVTVTVLLGPVGPMSVHTPEICYSRNRFSISQQRRRVSIRDSGSADEQFWALTMRADDVEAQQMQVYYAWSEGGAWSAPSEPRFSLAGRPFLYKIQVAGFMPIGSNEDQADPCNSFLTAFLPVARRYLAQVDDE